MKQYIIYAVNDGNYSPVGVTDTAAEAAAALLAYQDNALRLKRRTTTYTSIEVEVGDELVKTQPYSYTVEGIIQLPASWDFEQVQAHIKNQFDDSLLEDASEFITINVKATS